MGDETARHGYACTKDKWLLWLNEMDEFHKDSYKNARIYKERTKVWHEKYILRREFQPRQKVLLYNNSVALISKEIENTMVKSIHNGQRVPVRFK